MSEQKTYTVAVAALGKRGMHHAIAIKNNPRLELVGVCDIDEARVEAAKQQLGVSYGSDDAARMLRDTKPDVFVFCTLPQIRLPMIQAGVEHGVKLIAYEKPIAMSTNEALEMFRLTREAGIKTVVSHQHRYGEHYRKVKEIIDSGAIGRVHTVYGTSIGWMLHMFTHLIEYASWYNDYADPEWVAGQAWGLEKFSDVHVSPDYIGAIVGFANGVRGYIECGADAPDVPEVDSMWHKCRIGAQGTEGFAEVLTGKAGKGGGWRAVTKDGVHGRRGRHGLRPRHAALHPGHRRLAGRRLEGPSLQRRAAFKGFQVMMGALRSVVQRGKVRLPLGPGEPELDALQRALAG